MSPSETDTTSATIEQIPLSRLVAGHLVRQIADLDPGELAELRRWTPDQVPSSPTFWRIVLWQLEPAGWMQSHPKEREPLERRWAAVLAAMATLHDLYARDRRLGEALHAANVSEARVTRLLRAEGDFLLDGLRGVVHQLHSAREPVDWTELAALVLSDGWSDEARDSVRIRIARNYYSAQSSSENKGGAQ